MLLILFSQVGLAYCMKSIPWSEVCFLGLLLLLFDLLFSLTIVCFADRFRWELRHMDFDTLLRVRFEHHSLISFVSISFSFGVFHLEVLILC